MSAPTLIERARALLAATPPVPEGAYHTGADLAAFAIAFAEALPGIYREHDEGSGDPFQACAAHPESIAATRGLARNCSCGATDSNAALDALADKLGIPPEERRR